MAAEEENDVVELEESITKEKTTKKKKTSISKTQDDLMVFLAGIKGISEVMKKRLHKVLGSQGITDPRGIKTHTLKQLMELPGVSENTAKLLLEEVESNQFQSFCQVAVDHHVYTGLHFSGYPGRSVLSILVNEPAPDH